VGTVDFVTGLKCRVCGKLYPKAPINFCTDDFGPLEVDYDYEGVSEVITRDKIELRPRNMWRYR
jgi:threonine synthase